ncbi:DR1 [Acrasis kona]|uniref:DR1 n=1 Tax=Acrasis kona TaxID=1008807 RepID=A0AAW2ZMZ4_9EUKA
MSTEDDVSLPKATISKVIKEHLAGDNIRCANDTRDMIVDCCVEFVQMIATEANDLCTKEKKKTISAEHITDALKILGYTEYINEVNTVLQSHKDEITRSHKIANKQKNSHRSQEDLILEQRRLINESKARTQPNTPTQQPQSPFGTPTNPQQAFQITPPVQNGNFNAPQFAPPPFQTQPPKFESQDQ